MHSRHRWSLLSVAALVGGCAPLEPFVENVCGNQVLERDRGEDCDTFPAEEELAGAVTPTCGAPTVPAACRYVCGADGAGCPSGWACSPADRICRKPALDFVPGASTVVSVLPEGVVFADFDGSGSHDLAFFAGSDLVIRYATGAGSFGPEYVDAIGLASVGRSFGFDVGASVGHIDEDDALADLVAPTPGGALVMKGSRSQTLVPVPYPAIAVQASQTDVRAPALVPVSLPGVLRQDAVFVAYAPLVSQTLVFPAFIEFNPTGHARLPAPRLGQMGPEAGAPQRVVAVADLDRDGGSELAIGHIGDTEIGFVTVRALDGPNPQEPRMALEALRNRSVTLPAPLRDTLAFADADGDGRLDLIAEVGELGTPARIAVATYVATSTSFRAPALVPGDVWGQLTDGGVLAVGDVNLDGRADYVVAGLPFPRERGDGTFTQDVVGGVLVSRGSELVKSRITDDLLVEAVISDFNRDGSPDIAATNFVTPGIGVFLGSGIGVFNPSRVETNANATMLRVGDFDGDYVGDLLFAEADDGGEAVAIGSRVAPPPDAARKTVRLQVAFGRSQGAPGAPVSMGEIPLPLSLEPALYIDHDLVRDLLVLTADDDMNGGLATYGLYAFRGASDRRLRSVLGIAGPGRALAGVWMGNFDDTEGVDLVAFALPVALEPGNLGDSSKLLWGLRSAGVVQGEAGSPVDAGQCLRTLYDTTTMSGGFVRMMPLDADDRGTNTVDRDVLVRWGSTDEVVRARGELSASILTLRLESTDATCADITLDAAGLGEVSSALVVDADGSGRPDLVLVQAPGSGDMTNGVTVRWDARITGAGAQRALRHDGTAVIEGPEGEYLLDVVLADVDVDGRADVVAGAYGGVYVARQLASRTFEPFQRVITFDTGIGVDFNDGEPATLPDPTPFISGPTRLFAEDVDGDALIDLLLIRGREIQTYLSTPVAAGGAPGSIR